MLKLYAAKTSHWHGIIDNNRKALTNDIDAQCQWWPGQLTMRTESQVSDCRDLSPNVRAWPTTIGKPITWRFNLKKRWSIENLIVSRHPRLPDRNIHTPHKFEAGSQPGFYNTRHEACMHEALRHLPPWLALKFSAGFQVLSSLTILSPRRQKTWLPSALILRLDTPM